MIERYDKYNIIILFNFYYIVIDRIGITFNIV